MYLAGPGHIGKSALSSIILEVVSEPVTPDKVASIDCSRLTNGLPMHLFELLFKAEEIVEKGCAGQSGSARVSTFAKAKNEAWVLRQRTKAEWQSHVSKGNWPNVP